MALKNIVVPAPQTYGPHGTNQKTGNIPNDYPAATDKGDDKITTPRK